jgi:hypothetical protein
MSADTADTDTKGADMTATDNGQAPYQHADTVAMSADTAKMSADILADRVAKLEMTVSAMAMSADKMSVSARTRTRTTVSIEVLRWTTVAVLLAVAAWRFFG